MGSQLQRLIMARKYSRYQSVISTQSNSSEDHWLHQFEAKLQKGAVQPRHDSLFDQINTIMNGKAKYPSVQAAVDDMMHRSGLTAYLDDVKVSHEDVVKKPTKVAGTTIERKPDQRMPKIIQNKPSILNTLENIIEETHGNMPVPAIIARLHSLHSNDITDEGVWEDDDLIRLVSKLNLKAKANNPASYESFSDLGKGDHSTADSDIDISNTDAFNALMPAKI